MLYLQQDNEEADNNKRFKRTWMFDGIIKSFMILFEETLKSKEKLSHMKVVKLEDQLVEKSKIITVASKGIEAILVNRIYFLFFVVKVANKPPSANCHNLLGVK